MGSVNSLLYSSLGWEPSRFRRWKFLDRELLLLREWWPDLIPIFNSANLHESRAPANVCELLVSIEGVNVRYTVGIPHAILSWYNLMNSLENRSPFSSDGIIRGEIIPRYCCLFIHRFPNLLFRIAFEWSMFVTWIVCYIV